MAKPRTIPTPIDGGTEPEEGAEPKKRPAHTIVEVLDRTRRDIVDISPPYKEDDMDSAACYSLTDSRGRTRYYDVNGIRIYRKGEAPDPVAAQPAPQAQPPRAPKPTAAAKPGPGVKAETANGEMINLTMWAERKVRYPFAKVRQTINERYSYAPVDERAAINFLIDEKVADAAVVLPLWRMTAADDEAAA